MSTTDTAVRAPEWRDVSAIRAKLAGRKSFNARLVTSWLDQSPSWQEPDGYSATLSVEERFGQRIYDQARSAGKSPHEANREADEAIAAARVARSTR